MDKKRILQVIGPGLAAAFVLLLVGVLIFSSEWAEPDKAKATGKPPMHNDKPGASAAVAKADSNDSGMSDSIPPAEAAEWVDLGDGLKMWDVVVGGGDVACPPGASVSIHYTGWNLNGNVFDSSRSTGRPADFPLGNLIKGWRLGIPGMKPGGIRRLKIPGPLAYGPNGSPPKIGPNATLIFEVKLLGFN